MNYILSSLKNRGVKSKVVMNTRKNIVEKRTENRRLQSKLAGYNAPYIIIVKCLLYARALYRISESKEYFD